MANLKTIFGSLAAGAMLALGAAPAKAEYIEKGYLKLENRAETKRKICIFAAEQWKIVPRKCFTLEPKDWVLWKREKPNERFRAAFYETRRGPDKLLKSLSLARDTVYLATSGNAGSAQSRWKPRPAPPKPQYRVKFCNSSQQGTVWLTIAAAGGMTSMTEGYWAIQNGKCLTINYSERFTRVGGGVPDSPLMVMYRAFTTGENARTWAGSEVNRDPKLCVDTDTKFAFNLWKNGTMKSGEMRACDGEGESKQYFLVGPSLDKDVQIGRVDF